MADYTATISNSIYCFGGGVPIAWGAEDWGAFDWGDTSGIVNLIDKHISNSEVVTNTVNKETIKYIYNSEVVTGTVYKLPSKFIDNSEVVTNTVYKLFDKSITNDEVITSVIAFSFRKQLTQVIGASSLFSPDSMATDTAFVSAPLDYGASYLESPNPDWNYDFAYPSMNADTRFVSGWTRV